MPGTKPASRPGRSLSLRGTLVLCVLSGLLLSLAFPPAGLWPLAWVALVPWIAALRTGSRFGAFLGSWLGGMAFFGALLYWLHLFGISVWLVVTILLGAALAVWGVCARRLGHFRAATRILGTAVLWCGVEWARGLGQYGFTWGWLGYSQSPALALLPFARYAGTLGLSFLIALANASLAEVMVAVIRRSSPAAAVGRAVLGCALVAALLGGANLRARGSAAVNAPQVRMAVIQGSDHGPLAAREVNTALTPEEQAHTLEVYASLTRKAAEQRPALVVWPESVLVADPEDDPRVAARMSVIVRGSRVWLLAGGISTDDRGRPVNSAYLYAPSGNVVARYDKVQLVPFGEYVPMRERLPFLKRYHVREQDFVAGVAHTVLQAGTIPVGPSICFESTFPTISWELVSKGAQVLVTITNDSWFGRTAAAAQHHQIAVLRAVESERWVLRAASTGISSIISPEGKIVEQAGLYHPAALTANVPLLTNRPLGVRLGPAVGWGMMTLALAFVIGPCARRREGGDRVPRKPAAKAKAGGK
jgi:apolipoprotein N-acyltransferase